MAEKGEQGDSAVDYVLKVTPNSFNASLNATPILTIQAIKIDGQEHSDITLQAIEDKKIEYQYNDETSYTVLTVDNGATKATLRWTEGKTSINFRYKIADGIYETETVESFKNGEKGDTSDIYA